MVAERKNSTLKMLALRIALFSAVSVVLLWRLLRLPGGLLPHKLRLIHKYWDISMMWQCIRSGALRLPMDQPCSLDGSRPAPAKARVAPEHTLSEVELADFYRNGFLQPFRVFDEQHMASFKERLLAQRDRDSLTYGFATDRDRHLEMPEFMEMMAHPAITDRLAQLLGPDLVLWRSQIFHKPVGGRAIQWHQASTYMFEESFFEPIIVPPNRDELFQLTVWIAVDPATRENGCMKFVRGTQDKIRNIRLGGDEGFYATNFEFEFEANPADVEYVEMQPGEVLIFSERTIHGSDANRADYSRLAFNFRVVPAGVEVYPGNKKVHRAVQMGESFDLSRWNAVVIAGEDHTGVNKTVDWRELAAAPAVR